MIDGSSESKTDLLRDLKERAKELNCLYRIEELLSDSEASRETLLKKVVESIPSGWQYPDICEARITYAGKSFQTRRFIENPTMQCVLISEGSNVVGRICVAYREQTPASEKGAFLAEEARLLETIARRISDFMLHQQMRRMFAANGETQNHSQASPAREWKIMLEFLNNTDRGLLIQISRKMMNHLCWKGVHHAQKLLKRFGEMLQSGEAAGESNEPQAKAPLETFLALSEETFRAAEENLSEKEIVDLLHKWIEQDRLNFLMKAVCNAHSSLDDINKAILRYQQMGVRGAELSASSRCSIRVALIRKLFTDDLAFINVAEKHIDVEDLFELLDHTIFVPGSEGKLGGKGAGLIVAGKILQSARTRLPELGEIKLPRSWYVTADSLIHFISYNDLEEVFEQKYKSLGEVRREHPHIVQVFKNSHFPPELQKGLASALDSFGERPLIVRSSSLLEDRFGSAFSGKYKSLFLANQGPRKKRLEAMLDAIAEVYASTCGPDPIEYRAERGLLNFNEEMGVIIQEVVGKKVGKFFFPAWSGVALSNNELRWSPRIRRKDGLVRLVPGLGTRAVDRLGDEYPLMVSPGQAGLRVNASVDEAIRYSPRKIDMIDLQKHRFCTHDIKELIRASGSDFPGLSQIVSVLRDGRLQRPNGVTFEPENEELVVTFEGLLSGTPFVQRISTILRVLEDGLGTPVDIEFASDGNDFYLLQCRPQNLAPEDAPASMPRNVAGEDLLFSAHRYVSNGRVTGITHIVYVDPEGYSRLSELETLNSVGHAVGRLNAVLPRRKFILIGPGRWGSRGDVKLGVRVSYSEINNTAMLIEVARRKGQYTPDVSFGTHFFQDLVEASIKYLPLYPDDKNECFNEQIFNHTPNSLAELLPEYSHLNEALRVIDLPANFSGRTLSIYMNGEQEEALALLEGGSPSILPETTVGEE